MNLLQLVNEILRKADEPLVTSTEAHDGVRKIKLFLKETGRELAYNYRIPEAVRVFRAGTATPTAQETPYGISTVITPTNGDTDIDKDLLVDSLNYDNGASLGTRHSASSVMRKIMEMPTRIARKGDKLMWCEAPTTVTSGGGSAFKRIYTFPQWTGTVIAFIRYNDFARDTLLDTDTSVMPPHLMVLGGYAKWMADSRGSDSPDAQKAQAVFETAVSSHVAIAAEAEDSPKDWIPE